MKKTTVCFLAALVLFVFAFLGAAADPAPGISSLKLNPYGGAEDSIDAVLWHASGETYFLFLPSDADLSTAKVYFTANSTVTLDGAVLVSGESASAFTPGSHTLRCGEELYPLTVCVSSELPAVFIATDSGSLDYIHADKENREPGSIRIYENGVMTLDKELRQIKGRGNSTWNYPKKPYNIKFDKKTDLFGMGKAKKWTLLANYIDPSMIHNAWGWEFGCAFGLPCTGEYRYVDLYVNGTYLGSYVLCESVEVGENRIDIPDLDKANENANPGVTIEELPRGGTGENNTVQSGTVKGSRKWVELPQEPADLTGGYLLEFEVMPRYNEEISGFVTTTGQPVVLKSPEYASRGEVGYIADFTDACFEALASPTGRNRAGRHYSDYVDTDSLAAAYILQELSMNYDAGITSFFAYKPAGQEKLIFAPVWDMDNAFGVKTTYLGVALDRTDLWWANQRGYRTPSVLSLVCRHPDFRALVREKWAALRQSGAFEAVEGQVSALADRLGGSAVMNALRWGRSGTDSPEASAAWWRQNVQDSLDFVAGRTAALDTGFGPDGAYLYYDLNGANGNWSTASPIRRVGESVTVRQVYGNGTLIPPRPAGIPLLEHRAGRLRDLLSARRRPPPDPGGDDPLRDLEDPARDQSLRGRDRRAVLL